MTNDVTYFPTLTATAPEPKTWEGIVTIIRNDTLREKTTEYRALADRLDRALSANDKATADSVKKEMAKIKRSCPAIVCQTVLDGGKDKACIRSYTGYMMVDFDHVPADQMVKAIRLATEDSHTFIAYTTISGCGFRVIARVEGIVNADNYRSAWLSVNNYYKQLTGLDYDAQCSNATRLCGLAWDSQAIYRPLAKRIKIDVSLDRKKARKGKGAGRPPKAGSIGRRVRQMVEADGAAYTDNCRNDYVSRCIYLMNRYGVDIDDCISWALDEFEDYAERHHGSVESIVKSVYQTKADEHATLSACTGKNKASVKEMERYIDSRYVIRRNLLSMKLEYCEIMTSGNGQGDGGSAAIAAVDDHFVNSLWRQMQFDGISVDVQTINTILCSDFVKDYHPFRSWIHHLKPWDGTTDHIRRFFSMVHCKDTPEELFHFLTRCWFLAMVASVLDDRVVNHEILTFIGRQGSYKSSFMLHILPPHLRSYYATKNNSCQLTKDDHLMLAQNIIISLEEIDAMSAKEINQLKAFTTMPHINERPPYARHTVLMPRVASLTATGNNLTFLTDQTGNRRWLPFHVDSIDNPWGADIPYEGMYAQALWLIGHGERYWLNDGDLRLLNEHNRSFLAPDPAREMIVTYYYPPRTEAEAKYMTATKIAGRFSAFVKVSPTKVGIALAELGFEQIRRTNGRFWKVAERQQIEIDSCIPDEIQSESGGDKLPF